MDKFYKQLGDLYDEHKFTRDSIWNMDETGFPTVPSHVQKILAESGSKRVGQMSSAERGTNVSAALAINAAGRFIPPFFIYLRANYQSKFMLLAEGKEGHANKSGYMQAKEFHLFMVHFQKHVRASIDEPVLLLLDNHTSHLSIQSIDYAIEHGIQMLTFPPHCTHKLQPLDVGVLAQVKSRYVEKHNEWMKSHGGAKFDLELVAPIVEKCLDERATVAVIKSAFERPGIFELNSREFTDSDFFAAQKLAEADARAAKTQEELEESGEERVLLVMEENIPIESGSERTTSDVASVSGTSSITSNLNVAGPVRIVGKKKSNRGRQAMTSAVLTSPAKRDEIKAAADKRAKNKRKAEERAEK